MPEHWETLFDFTNYLVRTHLPRRYWGSREWEYCFNSKDQNADVILAVWTREGEYQANYVLTLMEASQVKLLLTNEPLMKREIVEKISLN